MLVNTDFTGLDTLNTVASAASVQLRLNQTFRVQGIAPRGAVVAPATRSQHLIGHAVDLNIVVGTTVVISSAFIAGTAPKEATDFVTSVKAQGLRWGGDFGDRDPPHFDQQVTAATDYDMKFFFCQRAYADRASASRDRGMMAVFARRLVCWRSPCCCSAASASPAPSTAGGTSTSLAAALKGGKPFILVVSPADPPQAVLESEAYGDWAAALAAFQTRLPDGLTLVTGIARRLPARGSQPGDRGWLRHLVRGWARTCADPPGAHPGSFPLRLRRQLSPGAADLSGGSGLRHARGCGGPPLRHR